MKISRFAGLAKNMRPNRLLRRLNSMFVGAGPYRFITRRYFGTDDIAMTSRLLEVESFRHDIVPQELPIANFRSMLLLAPHQDDEAIGAGGTLILGQKAGVQLTILYLTEGKPGTSYRETRRQESRNVCERLGAQMLEMNISNLEPRPTIDDLDRLNEIIRSVSPDVILCPWLLDGAPKHRMVNHLLWLVDKLSPLPNIEIWGYQVQNTLLPNGYVDITDVADEKRSLLECFPSQNRERHWDHVAMGLAAWNSRLLAKSDRPRYSEIFLTLPTRELLKLVEKFYFNDLSITYVGQPAMARNLRKLHQSVINKISPARRNTGLQF